MHMLHTYTHVYRCVRVCICRYMHIYMLVYTLHTNTNALKIANGSKHVRWCAREGMTSSFAKEYCSECRLHVPASILLLVYASVMKVQ